MKAIATTVTVTDDGKITLQLPRDISPGEHQVVLVIIDEQPRTEKSVKEEESPPLNYPVDNIGFWPADLS